MNFVIDYSKDKLPSQKDNTFVDLSWPLQIDRVNREFAINTDFNAVDIALHNIFNWMPGERILLPDFGNLIHRFVSDHINNITSKNIVAAVHKMFEWDSRVKLLNVDVLPNPDENLYTLRITYAIPVLDKEMQTLIKIVPLSQLLNSER